MRYRLKQNWGIYKAGDVIEKNASGLLNPGIPGMDSIDGSFYPDWFQPVDEPERWKPEKYKNYWTFNKFEPSGVKQEEWYNDSADKYVYEFGAIFKTEAEALAARDKVKELLLSLSKKAV